MNRFLTGAAFALSLLVSAAAVAGERTVTLAVDNMFCATCPYTVKKSLTAVPGVKKVSVSLKNMTAVVTYDDNKTNVNALTSATTNAGYPSAPKS